MGNLSSTSCCYCDCCADDRKKKKTRGRALSTLPPRRRLLALLSLYAPHRLKDTDDILREFNGDGNRAVLYYSSLLGPEPKPQEAELMYATRLTEDDVWLRKRVYEILMRCDPTRVLELESIVRGHKGTASELLQQLEIYYKDRDSNNNINNNIQKGGREGSNNQDTLGSVSNTDVHSSKDGKELSEEKQQKNKNNMQLVVTTPTREILSPPLPLQSSEWSPRDESPLGVSDDLPISPSHINIFTGGNLKKKRDEDEHILREFESMLAQMREAEVAILLPYRPKVVHVENETYSANTLI
ncbi:uncharacterized protein TM35_000361790 [Trypanosoma theileri]|uniref:Uncharacterized protein n=1 Tax=Trypanosoma theileri TaxID=67003 RepID=A0A1X0NME5_9TRYP|nr:uncharacterized protein TM35_000361790 [Trypanosoma theileri]ORC85319.1 hypothetical protein TM35_000361790 [Trypanosoma theileri]